MTLTARQSEVLSFIRESIATNGYAPSLREIMARFQISSPNGALWHLKALKKKGLITWQPGLCRTITLTEGK